MGESLRHSRLGSFESTNEVGIAAAAVGFPRSPLLLLPDALKKSVALMKCTLESRLSLSRLSFSVWANLIAKQHSSYVHVVETSTIYSNSSSILRRSKAWKRAGEFEFCTLKTTRRETQKPFGSSISSWSEETFANLTASRTEAALIVASVVDSNYRIVGHRLQTIKQVRLFFT